MPERYESESPAMGYGRRAGMPISILFFLSLFIFHTVLLSADTIVKRDGSRLKGLVVEDYTDRIVFSTADGETVVMKKDISRLAYDEDYQNFLYLARRYQEMKRLKMALEYVNKALEIKPDSEEAVTMKNYMTSKLLSSREDDLFEKVELKKKIMDIRSGRAPNAPVAGRKKTSGERLRDEIGLTLSSREGRIIVDSVSSLSSADESGLKPGDRLVSIGGTLIRYWPPERVMAELLGPRYLEISLVIERDINIGFKEEGRRRNNLKVLGMRLSMRPEGLTVERLSEKGAAMDAGIREGDLLVAVNGNSTRYLPLKRAKALISKADAQLEFSVRRRKFIWRR